jgi:hypothetical protein
MLHNTDPSLKHSLNSSSEVSKGRLKLGSTAFIQSISSASRLPKTTLKSSHMDRERKIANKPFSETDAVVSCYLLQLDSQFPLFPLPPAPNACSFQIPFSPLINYVYTVTQRGKISTSTTLISIQNHTLATKLI